MQERTSTQTFHHIESQMKWVHLARALLRKAHQEDETIFEMLAQVICSVSHAQTLTDQYEGFTRLVCTQSFQSLQRLIQVLVVGTSIKTHQNFIENYVWEMCKVAAHVVRSSDSSKAQLGAVPWLWYDHNLPSSSIHSDI